MQTEVQDSPATAAAVPVEPASGLPLVAYEDYQQSRAHVFPSCESLRWFERQHRKELLEAGALCMPAGRKLVMPAVFDGVVLEIGRRLAAARGLRG